jgi:hypothetical protein
MPTVFLPKTLFFKIWQVSWLASCCSPSLHYESGFFYTTIADLSAKLTVAETALDFNEIPIFLSRQGGTKIRGKCNRFHSMKKIY